MEIENSVIITISKFKSEVILFDSYSFNNSVQLILKAIVIDFSLINLCVSYYDRYRG